MLKEELNIEFENWDGIPLYDKCVKHCHAKNVYSIVLKELEDNRLLRIYIAMPENELYKNDPSANLPMSVGFHNHRYHIGLKVLKGSLINHIVTESENGIAYGLYGYETGMNKTKLEKPKIQLKGSISIKEHIKKTLNKGDYFEFQATDIHSISTKPDELVAWIILEGKLDTRYNAKLITNDDLNDASTASLYQKMTKPEVAELLEQVF